MLIKSTFVYYKHLYKNNKCQVLLLYIQYMQSVHYVHIIQVIYNVNIFYNSLRIMFIMYSSKCLILNLNNKVSSNLIGSNSTIFK